MIRTRVRSRRDRKRQAHLAHLVCYASIHDEIYMMEGGDVPETSAYNHAAGYATPNRTLRYWPIPATNAE